MRCCRPGGERGRESTNSILLEDLKTAKHSNLREITATLRKIYQTKNNSPTIYSLLVLCRMSGILLKERDNIPIGTLNVFLPVSLFPLSHQTGPILLTDDLILVGSAFPVSVEDVPNTSNPRAHEDNYFGPFATCDRSVSNKIKAYVQFEHFQDERIPRFYGHFIALLPWPRLQNYRSCFAGCVEDRNSCGLVPYGREGPIAAYSPDIAVSPIIIIHIFKATHRLTMNRRF